MHLGGTIIFFVDCRYHCFFLDLSAVWINWLDMKTQISEQKQNKNHCFNYSLQIRGLPKLHYSTDDENIIGAPKMYFFLVNYQIDNFATAILNFFTLAPQIKGITLNQFDSYFLCRFFTLIIVLPTIVTAIIIALSSS